MSDECERGATVVQSVSLRASVSRYDYAAYCLAVHHVEEFGPFSRQQNPTHSQVAELIMRISGLEHKERAELRKILKELFKKRIDSDYRPSAVVDKDVHKRVASKYQTFKRMFG